MDPKQPMPTLIPIKLLATLRAMEQLASMFTDNPNIHYRNVSKTSTCLFTVQNSCIVRMLITVHCRYLMFFTKKKKEFLSLHVFSIFHTYVRIYTYMCIRTVHHHTYVIFKEQKNILRVVFSFYLLVFNSF